MTDKQLTQIYCNPKAILTGTDWKWLAEMLDIEVSELINTNHIKYMEV